MIEARFRTQMLQLGTTEQQAQAAAQQRKTLLNQRLTRDLAALDVSQRTATAQAAQEQSRHLPVLRKAQAGAERARHQYELAEQEARAQRTITYPRFVLFSLTGR